MNVQATLESAPSHFNWHLEDGTNKTFEALEQQLDDHIKQNPETMTIPALLCMSFLYMSGFQAPKTDHKNAKKYLKIAYENIGRLETNSPAWIGYLTVAKTNESIMESKGQYRRGRLPSRNVQKLVETIQDLTSKKTEQSEAYVHIVRAFALSRLGLPKYEEAQEYYQRAVDVEPENTQWLFGLALTIGRRARQLHKGRISKLPVAMQEEKRLYEKVVSIDQKHALAWCYLGQVLFLEGYSERALECCLEATKISSDNPAVMRMIGKIFRKEGHFDIALKIFQNCEDTGARSSYMYHHWGLVYRDIYNRDRYNRGLGSNRYAGRERGGRGRVSGSRGRVRESRGRGDKIRGSGGYDARCGSSDYAGRVRGGRGRGSGSRGRASDSRGRDHGDGSAYDTSGYEATGGGSDTRREDIGHGHQHCGANLQTPDESKLSIAKEAIRKFEKALECNPGNIWALVDKARMLEKIGDIESAREDFDEVVRVPDMASNDRVTIHYNYGLFLKRRRKKDEECKYEAMEQFRSAIECALQNSTITKYRGQDGFMHPTFNERINDDIKVSIEIFEALATELSSSPCNEKKCDGLRQVAWLKRELGNIPDAIARYRECLDREENANDIEAIEGLVKCLIQMSKFSEVEILIGKLKTLDPDIAKECALEAAKCHGQYALQSKNFEEARRLFLETLDLGSIDCCDGLFTVLQSCSEQERRQWKFRADCGKLVYYLRLQNPNEIESIAERLSGIDLDQEGGNANRTSASFIERVESLMDLNHSVYGTLRHKHLRMEDAILQQGQYESKATLDAAADVLKEIHALLGHVMMAFKKKHYPDSKPLACPYYYIPAGKESKIGKEEEVRADLLKRLEKDYKWTGFSSKFSDLLNFLVKVQPAYDLRNNWYRAVAKLKNLASHDSALFHAAYDVPKLFLSKNDDNPIPVGQPVYTTASQPGAKNTEPQGPGSEDKGVAASTKGDVNVDEKYERYVVRDLARKATTEVEHIVAEFYKYIKGPWSDR